MRILIAISLTKLARHQVKCQLVNPLLDTLGDNDSFEPSVGASAFDTRGDALAGCPQVPGVPVVSGRAYVKYVSPDTGTSSNIDLVSGRESQAVDRLVSIGFNLTKPTLLYSHGWQESAEFGWLQTIRERYATQYPAGEKPFNLLQFDWSQASHYMYPQAVLSAPFLGKRLGSFFNSMNHRYNYTMDNLHMIGFSLSTHIIGAAGNELKRAGNIAKQITALDSAGPCFYTSSPFARANTLAANAAQNVVARHYGDDKYGARAPIGGVDIYVNGGKNQPVTSMVGGRSRSKRDVPDAAGLRDHISTVYHEYNTVAERGDQICHSVAYRCESYAKFLHGGCASCNSPTDCYHIGSFLQTERISELMPYPPGTRMFIQAGPSQRCLHHYQVVIEPKSSASDNTMNLLESGRAQLDLGSGAVATAKGQTTCADGSTAYTALVTSPVELTPTSASIRSIPSGDIAAVQLNYMSHEDASVRAAKSSTLCPRGNKLAPGRCYSTC